MTSNNNKILTDNQIIENLSLIASESRNEKIPIIEETTARFLIEFIRKNNIMKVLEIGTASAYSALVMALAGTKVTTIERDREMYMKAVNNILVFNDYAIDIIFGDALNIDLNTLDQYDLIFIDGAKGQYRNFLIKYESLIHDEGFILFDNMNFHNLDIRKVSRRTKTLIKKIENFKVEVTKNENYICKFLDIGDGLLLLRRRKF